MDRLNELPLLMLNNLGVVWSFMLVLTRYVALLALLPGLGAGRAGIAVRTPGAIVLSFASVLHGPFAELPANWALAVGALLSEYVLGSVLGLIPALIVAGVDMAAGLSATTMGLGAAQLMDPRMGGQTSALGRVMGDLVTCLFLLMGGHHVIVYAAAGLGGQIVPGSYMLGESSVNLFIDRSAHLFLVGVMISAPVVVALLLTQFVMGLISKAVPTVNIFIVSFPLTIGIGLILTVLSLPEVVHYSRREILQVEQQVSVIMEDAKRRAQPDRDAPVNY